MTPCQEYGHQYDAVASWPNGRGGETTLMRCRYCGDEYEEN